MPSLLPIKYLFHEAFWVTLVVVPICTMLTIMTNVAMNNKSRGYWWCSSYVNYYPIDSERRDNFVRVCSCIRNFHGSFVAILVNYDIDRIRLF